MTDAEQPSNTLVLAPSLDDRENEACIDLSTPTGPARENLLSITFSQSADERLDVWGEHAGGAFPVRAAFVDVGETTRAATPSATLGAEIDASDVSVEVVSDPGDLAGIGVAITRYLSEWTDAGDRTVVCLHSATAMLQHAELEQVFQFLHVLTREVTGTGAVAHVHVDPTAHDTRVVNTLKTLFDAVDDRCEDVEAWDPDGAGRAREGTHSCGWSGGELRDGNENGNGHGTHGHSTEYDVDESPSQAIVRAIASIEGVDPLNMDEPLYDWIDPDALDSILSPASGSNGDVRVEFSAGAYRVSADGESVTIYPMELPSHRG